MDMNFPHDETMIKATVREVKLDALLASSVARQMASRTAQMVMAPALRKVEGEKLLTARINYFACENRKFQLDNGVHSSFWPEFESIEEALGEKEQQI